MNRAPYLLVATRGSRITTMPESLLVRISRPTPCRKTGSPRAP